MRFAFYILLVISSLVSIHGYGQFVIQKSHTKADTLWLKTLVGQYDSSYIPEDRYDNTAFQGTRVFYSGDKKLRFGEIIELSCNGDCEKYHTVISFGNKKQTFNINLDTFYLFSRVTDIYALPITNSYLILFEPKFRAYSYEGVDEWLEDFLTGGADATDSTEIEMEAFAFTLTGNKIKPVYFCNYSRWWDNNSEVLRIESYRDPSNNQLPYLNYDSAGIHFQKFDITLYDDISVTYFDEGIYHLGDTAFLLKETTDDYTIDPPLETLNDTISIHSDSLGNFFITTTIYDDFEEVGYYYDEVQIQEFRHDCYSTGSHTFCGSTYEFDDTTFQNKKPYARLQPDGSLILITRNFTNGFSPGECGACDYEYYHFYRIHEDESDELFLIESNLGNGYVWYSNYSQNIQNSNFYNSDSIYTYDDLTDLYWQNDSTIVLELSSSDGAAEDYYRIFYLSFSGSNAILTPGEKFLRKEN